MLVTDSINFCKKVAAIAENIKHNSWSKKKQWPWEWQ